MNWQTLKEAVEHDVPLMEQDVCEIWDDRFITNVVEPILNHMRTVLAQDLEQYRSQIDQGNPPRIDQFLYTQSAAQTVGALALAQHACKEWRG